MANTSNMSSETARRMAMGLSPSTFRRESGKVTENDIQEFLAETRAMVSKRMSADEVEDFMYDFEKRTRAENPIKQPVKKPKRGRKKLPTKPKIDLGDSVVIVDKNENVSTVVPAEAKPQGNVPLEAKTQERQSDRQSFKGMAKSGVLGLGSAAFNKMFPTLGKGLDTLKSRLEKQEKNTADNNTANKSYSRQVERSSIFLNTMSENLNKTNDILQQILAVVNRNATNNQVPAAAGGLGGIPNIDLPDGNRGGSQQRRTQTVPDTSPRAKPRMSLGRAGMFGGIAAGVAGLGAWAYSAFSGRGEDNAQPEPPQAAQPVPQDAPPASKPTPQATPSVSQSPPAAAPGTEYDITTGAPIGAPAARVQTPPQAATPAATPTPATTELTPRQRGMVDRFLRSKQLQEDQTARELAENIVTRIRQTNSLSLDERSLDSNYTRIRIGQSPIGMLIAHQPVIPGQIFTSNQMRAIGDGIMMNGRQHYPAVVLEQYDRQKNGNATPEPAAAPAPDSATTAQPSTNEVAASESRPGIRIGREIGESSRVAAPPPTATTPAPVVPPAGNETEDQIYNRLLQEQPENFRNNIDVQNDARAEARLRARARQASQTATPVSAPPGPVTEQTATPEASGAVNPMTDPSGFNARILNVRAQEILFKADKFEYSEGFQLATGSPTPTPGPAAGAEGPSSAGGATPGPTPAATTGMASAASPAGVPGVTQIGSANITGLDFAAGVDQRINPGIADKTKEIQSAFGKKLTVTSGFRDPARNARVGGAGGSKHLTADAVDVQFPGNQQETIDLIKVASEKGAGGIGVYRPGFLHIDTGAKRVWGPDYKATSIPDWAKPALDEHMGKPASKAGGGAAAGGGETASPMPGGQQQAAAGAASPSAPAATPEPSMPSSGAAMSSASVADETASRPSAGPTAPPPDTTAPITAAPQSPSLPGIDPNNPGSVEPADAGIRYSRLFNIAA